MIVSFSDLRYALRLLSKAPGFTALTVGVMAAGIGLGVYMFALLNIFFYKDLPFKDSDSMVRIFSSVNSGQSWVKTNPLDYQEMKSQVKGLSEIAAFDNISISVVGRDDAERYKGSAVEAGFFEITRTQPVLGRVIKPSDNQAGAEKVMVLSYDMWQTKFHGREDVLQESLRVDGERHKIVGVMPEGYFFPGSSELWVALQKDPSRIARSDAGRDYHIVGHIADGYSFDDVNKQLALIMQRIEKQYPDTNAGKGAFVSHFKGRPQGPFLQSMRLIAVLIIILASLNVGNLLYSRAIQRSKETAIRAALGAPRWVLIRQMVLESTIICSLGGLIGLLFVGWFLQVSGEVFRSRFIADRPFFWLDFSVDAFTVQLCLAFVVLTIFLTGFLPAWKNSGANFNSVLRDGTRGALSKRSNFFNKLLVISEIFVSMTVLLTAGMLIISSYRLTHTPVGADTSNKFIGKIILPQAEYATPEKKALYLKTLSDRLENSTGIGNVMVTTVLPGDPRAPMAMFAIDGKEYTTEAGYPRSNYITQSISSFPKMGIELVAGRYFDNSDRGLDKSTIVVTESFAKRHFANTSAVGKRIRVVENNEAEHQWLTIVGVVKHAAYGGVLSEQSRLGAIYRPYSQEPAVEFHVLMEMKAAVPVVFNTFRSTLASIDPNLPAFRFETYEGRRERFGSNLSFLSQVFLIFGFVAVVIAATGIYGLTSNTVNQKSQEIGVKRAMGAEEKRIVKEFLWTGTKQLLWGGIPGLLVGIGLGVAMSKQMGVAISDLMIIPLPLVFIIVAVVLLSTYLPTSRVLTLSPSQALRRE